MGKIQPHLAAVPLSLLDILVPVARVVPKATMVGRQQLWSGVEEEEAVLAGSVAMVPEVNTPRSPEAMAGEEVVGLIMVDCLWQAVVAAERTITCMAAVVAAARAVEAMALTLMQVTLETLKRAVAVAVVVAAVAPEAMEAVGLSTFFTNSKRNNGLFCEN